MRVGQAYIVSMKTVQILSLTKNEIIIKKPRKNRGILFLSCILILILSIGILSLDSLSNITTEMTYVYNPVNSLYNDTGELTFTSGIAIEKELLDFIIPIKAKNIEIDVTGSIVFEIGESIMVKSPEAGVVSEIGFSNDGVKYIKIKHGIEMSTVISNLDIIGVVEGEVVKKGGDIATAKEGESITMQIFENNVPLTNLKINQSKIIWKD